MGVGGLSQPVFWFPSTDEWAGRESEPGPGNRAALWLRATHQHGANTSLGLSTRSTHCPVQLLACPLLSAPWAIFRPCSPLRRKTSLFPRFSAISADAAGCGRTRVPLCCALLSRTGESLTVAEFPLLLIEWVSRYGFPQGTSHFRLALKN